MSQSVYQNDPAIGNEERLFRRVHLIQVVRDDDTGFARISSGAFRDRELSIQIESILEREGKSVESCLANHQAHKLASLTAGEARLQGQAVCEDPLPDDASHGLIFGSKNSKRINEGLRLSAKWVIPPEAPLYADILKEKRALGIAE
jgi:hypothetical protein